MLKLRRATQPDSGPTLQMTAMIDIVFLLLVFFVMTFKIVVPEGDFPISMAGPARGPSPEQPLAETIRVRLHAGPDGALAGLEVGGRNVANMAELQQSVWSVAGLPAQGGASPAAAEVEFAADPGLDYRHLMDAFTAIRGRIGPRGEVITLIEKIKLLPARG